MKLPLDAEVEYIADFLSPDESKRLYEALIECGPILNRKIQVGDKTFEVDAGKVNFVAPALVESGPFGPEHGTVLPWMDEICELAKRLEAVTGRQYRVCVGLYYENGERGADFHADLPAFGDVSSIASISLGQERAFAFRRIENPAEVYRLSVTDGSLLVMGEHCQERYEHALLLDPECRQPRINLTFRKFGW